MSAASFAPPALGGGQSLLEFAMMLPLRRRDDPRRGRAVSYALLDQHVVTKLTREGSNLISRDTTLQDAATALGSMASRPVDFSGGNSRVIFSVIRHIDTTGTTNFDKPVLFQRYQYGGLSASSMLSTTRRRVVRRSARLRGHQLRQATPICRSRTCRPASLTTGGMLYVTEIYHEAHADHAVRQVRHHRADHAVLDRLFLNQG